ncbi:MAG: T9SS type A sorting domain-containing protein [Bacteroidales bacterium]|jgi:hypothetical protein|nr:T9SS type A sorting domain-containing protein [Bacteroidales bacterium]
MNRFSIFFFFFTIFILVNVQAQIPGCTDPLANNYNAAATINDGSCTYNTALVSPTSSTILAPGLAETSGLIFWNNSLWTHNDNSDINLYSLDTLSGTILQNYTVTGVANIDWEEISQDDIYVYVGDFGNNANGNRTDLKILRMEKNSLLLNNPVVDTINFSYSNQTDFSPTGGNNTDFDCEAFVVSSDSIFLFTKQWVSNKTSIYTLPKTPGSYIANLESTCDVSGLVTGATYLQDKRLIVLCGYSMTLQPFLFLLYDFNENEFFNGNKRKISLSLPFHQVEGIATKNGLIYYCSNEYFSSFKVFTSEQKLHIVDMSTYLNYYLNDSISNIFEVNYKNNINVFPNPARDYIIVKTENTENEKNYFISDMEGKIVLSGLLQSDSSSINVRKLKKGTYFLKIGPDIIYKWVKE